jgi:hypothetical protein
VRSEERNDESEVRSRRGLGRYSCLACILMAIGSILDICVLIIIRIHVLVLITINPRSSHQPVKALVPLSNPSM